MQLGTVRRTWCASHEALLWDVYDRDSGARYPSIPIQTARQTAAWAEEPGRMPLSTAPNHVTSSAANSDSLPTHGPLSSAIPRRTPCLQSRLHSPSLSHYLLTPFPSRPSPSSLRSPNLSGRSHADRPSIISRCHKRARHLENPVVPCRTLCTRPLPDRILVWTVSLLGIHFYCEKGHFSYVLLIYFLRYISRSPLYPLQRFPFYFSPIAIELHRFCLALADHAHAVARLDTVQ